MKVNSELNKQLTYISLLEVETFTMDQGNGRKSSCIQVKLHSYF